jgi:hypothetical protein
MNPFLSRAAAAGLPALAALVLNLFNPSPVLAAPGAHGPNGEHLDGPAATAAKSASPRLEAKSESFELVATLFSGELSVLIDRFETNEPVLNAVLEVESGGIKSKATFHADQGDYAFDDAKLLALLRKPGEHALLFTLTAGKDNDLLDGTLITPAVQSPAKGDHAHDDHGHDHAHERAAWAMGGVVVLALAGGGLWWRKRRNNAVRTQGAL